MWLESYKESNYRRSKTKRVFKDNKPRSKGQTKDPKKGRYLSGLYSNNSSLKKAYVWNADVKDIILKTVKVASRIIQLRA